MRSFASREYGSHSMRPRGVSWMNRGIGTYSLRIAHASDSFVARSWLVLVIVIVIVVVVVSWSCRVVVSAARRREREIDLVAVLVDHGCVLDEELERLSPCNIRAYRLQRATPFELAPHLCGLLLGALGQRCDLGVDLFVARRRWPPARPPHAARGRRARPAPRRRGSRR